MIAVLVVLAGAAAKSAVPRLLSTIRDKTQHAAPQPTLQARIPIPNAQHVALYGNTAFVSDLDYAIRVVDLTTNAVVADIPLGEHWYLITGVFVDEQSHALVVVANDGADRETVVLIDLTSHQVTGTIPLGEDFASVAGFDPGLRTVYVGLTSDHHRNTALITADLDSRTVTGTLPLTKASGNIEVDPTTHRIYIPANDEIAIVDGATRTQTGTIATFANAVAVDPQARRLYATDRATPNREEENTVLKIVDLDKGSVAATVPSGKMGFDVAVDTASGDAYVISGYSTFLEDPGTVSECDEGWVTRVDPDSESVTGTLCMDGSSLEMNAVVDPVLHRLYVAGGGPGLLVVNG
ncbi:hypothetical protein HLB23_40245 [Nocardia uniformis]|uniref:YncE family protein n=1 Tax=Nocardia uniformis TaxID=53432 RepID=A0A849CAZ3_9NOCA|nr:hypothetical protein [Nocardia uniformis]NNH76013.1 hypothetical protein [Nocardia uniformis]